VQDKPRLKSQENPRIVVLCNRFEQLTQKPVKKGRLRDIQGLLDDYVDFLRDSMAIVRADFLPSNRDILYKHLLSIFRNPNINLAKFEREISNYDRVINNTGITQGQTIRETVEMFRLRYENGFDLENLAKLKLKEELKQQKNKPPSGKQPFLRKERFRTIDGVEYGKLGAILEELSDLGLGSVRTFGELEKSSYRELIKLFKKIGVGLELEDKNIVYPIEVIRGKVLEMNQGFGYGEFVYISSKGYFKDKYGNTWTSLKLIHKEIGFTYETGTKEGGNRVDIIKATKSIVVQAKTVGADSYRVYCLEVVKPLLDEAGLLKDQRTLKDSFR
jgi:hypothetical protein